MQTSVFFFVLEEHTSPCEFLHIFDFKLKKIQFNLKKSGLI